MEPGLDLQTVLMVLGFLLLIGMSAWHRHRLRREVIALPDDVRERLGWIWSGETTARRHHRLISRRLLLRGLPDWVPLSEQARRDLYWHRIFGIAAGIYLVTVMPAVWGAWMLVPMLAVPVAAVLAIQAWFDGPWGNGE